MANPFPFVAGAVLEAGQLNGIGEWTSYTPVLTATTTNPTLGTGSSATGSYARIQNLIIYRYKIAFGTSGVVVGLGDYRVSLPVNAAAVSDFYGQSVGDVSFYDSSANVVYYAAAWIGSVSQVHLLYQTSMNGTVGTNSSVNPVIPAINDAFTGLIIYQAA